MKVVLACIFSVLLLCSCSQDFKEAATSISDETTTTAFAESTTTVSDQSISTTSDNSIGLIEKEYNATEETVTEIETDYLIGNNPGNISNGGIAAIQDDWIFCSIIEDYERNVPSINGILIDVPIYGFYKTRIDGSEKIKLDDCSANYINVVNDWVYYAATTDDYRNCIYRIRTDGTEKTLLNDEACNYVNVCNNWIYYTSGYPSNIYKMRTDGTEKTLLTKDNKSSIRKITVAGDWIYYLNNGESKLYKMKTDGTGNERIVIPSNLDNHSIFEYTICDDFIYIDLNGIHKLSLSSQEIKKISDGYCKDIVVDGEWIYYIGGDRCLHRMKIDGSVGTRLNNEYTDQINVVGDYIFYRTDNVVDSQVQYKIRTDGTELEKVGTAEPMV